MPRSPLAVDGVLKLNPVHAPARVGRRLRFVSFLDPGIYNQHLANGTLQLSRGKLTWAFPDFFAVLTLQIQQLVWAKLKRALSVNGIAVETLQHPQPILATQP